MNRDYSPSSIFDRHVKTKDDGYSKKFPPINVGYWIKHSIYFFILTR